MQKAKIDAALDAMATLRMILEPSGGAIDWKGQSREKIKEFLRASANTQWLCGIAAENIILEVDI
jgi:hypothetical protein